ncbi:MgtC/SapB family protein [Paenibacillus sp. GCM10023248]|uniref:MgtC/SapB family protein n=1 Tax=Bacillales TaxID=1385 RepID=UPI00237889EF|nr:MULTISPECIES: MgtC/SapB family protein [Bacillales]MDD9266751.1 MgtC/SapB family protein [Paenibacillus sp. MAHUQ-63]
MMSPFVIKLGIALFLGMLIGIDRQLKHKPVGMKTNMVIAVASCLITMVSIESVSKFSMPGHTNMDPMRLAAQIVSGVGFLGAGVILRKSNDEISGLTTASMVWSASALGIATGAGYYMQAFVAVIFIILSVNLFPVIIKLIGPRSLQQRYLEVRIVCYQSQDPNRIFKRLKELNMQVERVKVKDVEGSSNQMELKLLTYEKVQVTDIYASLKSVEHVSYVEIESR